jgi:hypothetical protein
LVVEEETIAEPVQAKKARKELLEEHLTILSIKSPQNIELVTENDLKLFSSQVCQCLDFLKQKKQNPEVALAADFTDFMNCLCLRADIEDFGGEKEVEKEFKNCLKEIRALAFRGKLDGISQKIKEAENNKDLEKVQGLVSQFNIFSKSLRELEEPFSAIKPKHKFNFKKHG